MSPYARTQVFTTGQISKICQVAPRTVSKWFDTGRLHGYRIPGSNDRRVPRENLVAFMKEHGMPLGSLAMQESLKVLLVGVSSSVLQTLRVELPVEQFEFKSAATAFEAGVQAANWSPDCVVVDAIAVGRAEAEGMAQGLHRGNGAKGPLMIALTSAGSGTDEIGPGLFDDRFRPPFDFSLLAGRIRRLADRAATVT